MAGNPALRKQWSCRAASKKLRNEELLVVNFAVTRLRLEMDREPLWRGNHVAIQQLVDGFGRYLYLRRLQSTNVLVNAIRSGLALLTWRLNLVIADFVQACRLLSLEKMLAFSSDLM